MPIYAYKCQGCGHQLEKIQRLSDAPLTDCPKCNQPQLKKQITAAAFKLTGTGWYETDFKNNKINKQDSEKTSSKDGASTDQKSSESKSEKKSTSANKTSNKDAA